jgi:hypothetical protein
MSTGRAGLVERLADRISWYAERFHTAQRKAGNPEHSEVTPTLCSHPRCADVVDLLWSAGLELSSSGATLAGPAPDMVDGRERPGDESVPEPWEGAVIPEGYTFQRRGRCASCAALISWLKTPIGRTGPWNVDGTSHFASCPEANKWRKRKGSAPRERDAAVTARDTDGVG